MKIWKCISTLSITIILLAACSSLSERETQKNYIDDAIITRAVLTNILADHSIKVLEIHVETMHGVVQLSGFVNSKENDFKAVKIAAQVDGVQTVKDNLIIP